MTKAIGAVVALVLSVTGCGAASPVAVEGGAPDSGVTAEHPPGSSDGPREEPADADANPDALDGPREEPAGADANPDAPDGSDGPSCCAIDVFPTSCTNLGGADLHGCFTTCDFFCSTNWRVEADDRGCPLWKYDVRKPRPGENDICWADLDARDASSQDAD